MLLHPSKSKDLIPEIANKLNHSETLVKDVVDFYWKNIRKNLSALSHPLIHVANFGDFVFKHWKLDEEIKRKEHYQTMPHTPVIYFKIAEVLSDLKRMKEMLNRQNEKREFVKTQRELYELNKNLEK
jgi:nucleoid DNA-binding protein